MEPTHFEGRDLKPYAEPVSPNELKEGEIYFGVNFADDDMLIPVVEPKVFIGRNLEPDDVEQYYFQDIDSYRRGVRFESATEGEALFEVDAERHVFEFERALDVLMLCALRRKKILGEG